MRQFILIWFGQLISTIGSYMTDFALTLWAWQITGSATALALIGFFSQLPRIVISLFAGIIVDRFNRKYLMMLGDAIAACATVGILILHLTGQLAIWHLYLAASINGGFGQIQQLAYSTSITTLVSPQNYTRANSMNSAVHYGSNIIAPALAGVLYPIIGLEGILPIDLVTFVIAINTLLWIRIPQPQTTETQPAQARSEGKLSRLKFWWQEITFGIRYIWQRSSLRTLLIITTLFWFAHDLGATIDDPMILARSNSNSQVLSGILSIAGIGGITGAVILTAWGGTKQRINGMLAGFMGAGIAKTVFGWGQSLNVWLPAQFFSSINFPLLGSSETALWMEVIPANLQGRVFAANSLVLELVSASATLIAGLLSDRVLEPAMQSPSLLSSLFAPIFGTGRGAGMALLYVFTAIAMFLIGAIGYKLPQLRRLTK
ncbi:major facilitator superfamily MFS_1 [Stanieria cyanosphaera PCC 7437]|uniref:Major facilitator superfamily MFS_1 n=1 Tax=Stanieria cyanosphaera (strain ATCC 29371 / PCC 7437) TaxID=111780 RepID=K9XVU3_STAC7|nr:MFS transporter [Stanieria cyanosphaera]AFZ36206.1 major facilitator superfamily MFS_1 [Stanieria cyanosphaera PCC 7437]